MESFKNNLFSSFKKSSKGDLKPKKPNLPPEITSIEFHKRKRGEMDQEFENALTNSRKTIFDTRLQRETRNTHNYYGLSE